MPAWTRRDLFRQALAGPAVQAVELGHSGAAEPVADLPPADVYRLLGFATMTGEDPLKMWNRLRNAREWLVGPLSPDGWAGQVFVADHADIFSFRFLSLPAGWMKNVPAGKQADYCAENFGKWFRDNWPKWWKAVGPKAYDDSYARLVWQMPDGGPEVTYEWARTGINEVVCRITHSEPADLAVQAYVPWDENSLRGRSWVPGTRDGMRWVLATSAAPEDVTGTGLVRWHGYYRGVKRLYLCGRQGQLYEPLERATSDWLKESRIDQLLESNREKYLRTRPQGKGWLADMPAAINDQLEWSEVYTPARRRPYVAISRMWARENNSVPDSLWDSFSAPCWCARKTRPRRSA